MYGYQLLGRDHRKRLQSVVGCVLPTLPRTSCTLRCPSRRRTTVRPATVPLLLQPGAAEPPPSPPPPSPPPPAAPPTDGFFWGELGQSCDDACAYHGLTCNEAHAAAEHLPLQNTALKFVQILQTASDNTLGIDITQCSNYIASINSAAPYINTANGQCGYGAFVDPPSMFGGRGYSYNCAGTPAPTVRRICYCNTDLPPSPPPPSRRRRRRLPVRRRPAHRLARRPRRHPVPPPQPPMSPRHGLFLSGDDMGGLNQPYAELVCDHLGGTVAIIRSADEQREAYDLLTAQGIDRAWLGMKCTTMASGAGCARTT